MGKDGAGREGMVKMQLDPYSLDRLDARVSAVFLTMERQRSRVSLLLRGGFARFVISGTPCSSRSRTNNVDSKRTGYFT